MLKKKLHIALNIILSCFAVTVVNAQTSVTILETNINAQTEITASSVKVGSLGLGGGNVTVRSSTGTFPNVDHSTSPALDLNALYVKALYSGLISLGFTTEVTPTTLNQNIFTGLGLIGDVYVNYRIPTAGRAWLAGKYATSLIYQSLGTTPLFTITVPAYITFSSSIPATTAMSVNSFDIFRSTDGITSGNLSFGYGTTVPTEISVKAKNVSSFTFTPGYVTAETIIPPTSNMLAASLTSPVGLTKNITSINQLITTATALPVIVTNKRSLTTSFSVNGINLRTNFARAGVYKIPVIYTTNNTSDYLGSAVSQTMETSVEVTVPSMSDIKVPVSSVSLDFNNQADYNSGVTGSITNQVKLSSTVPYNITVKSTSSAFINSINSAITIPLSSVTIEGMSGQTGITPIVLSTDPQAIITNGSPVIDRSLNLQYRIPAAQVSNLLGKPQGTYNATIVYTIVAP